MESLWQKYGGSVQFVSVNLVNTQNDLINWLNNMTGGITYPVLHDPNWNITSLYASGTVYFPLIFINGFAYNLSDPNRAGIMIIDFIGLRVF